MRLGWLSRLGIVLTVFGLPITATYFANKDIETDRQVAESMRDICLKFVENPHVTVSADVRSHAVHECYAKSAPNIDAPMWPVWRNNLLASAIMFALAWILALAIYWSAVWILAGRHRKPRVIEAAVSETLVVSDNVEAQVRRGETSWTYLYTILGFALTIETGIVSVMSPKPLAWPVNLAVLVAALSFTAVAILNNSGIQNALFRIKKHYESKFR